MQHVEHSLKYKVVFYFNVLHKVSDLDDFNQLLYNR